MTTPAQDRTATKPSADFFISVRKRGILNTMLEGPALKFQELNPGWATRWEWYPANGDTTLVTAREASGYRVVDAEELGETASNFAQKTGPIRVGDLVLMAAPQEIHDSSLAADALAAEEDLKMPETAFRQNLESNKARSQQFGTEEVAKPVGKVTHTVEVVRPKGQQEQ